MTNNCGIYRDRENLINALSKVRELQGRYKKVRVGDKGGLFNTELVEALELSNMLEFSEVIVSGALTREESRGGHARTDFPKRDDENWLKHTLAYRTSDGSIQLKYKPVVITKHQPEERRY